MNNEDTIFLDNEDNSIQDETTNPVAPKSKSKRMSNKAKVAVAGAAGMAAGTVVGAGAVGVAVAANQNPEEQIADTTDPEATPETSDVTAAETDQSAVTEEPQHVTHVHHHVTHNHYTTEVHTNPEPVMEANLHDPIVTPVSHEIVADPVPVDNEVRILGVETVHHPDGFDMDVVGIAVGDDPALLVDVNQDGYLDVLVHDDNYNNNIEPNEIHDIREAELSMSELGIESEPHDYLASEEPPMDNFDDPNIMPV